MFRGGEGLFSFSCFLVCNCSYLNYPCEIEICYYNCSLIKSKIINIFLNKLCFGNSWNLPEFLFRNYLIKQRFSFFLFFLFNDWKCFKKCRAGKWTQFLDATIRERIRIRGHLATIAWNLISNFFFFSKHEKCYSSPNRSNSLIYWLSLIFKFKNKSQNVSGSFTLLGREFGITP